MSARCRCDCDGFEPYTHYSHCASVKREPATPTPPDNGKTSAWTDEDRLSMAEQRERDNYDAYERDACGNKIQMTSPCGVTTYDAIKLATKSVADAVAKAFEDGERSGRGDDVANLIETAEQVVADGLVCTYTSTLRPELLRMKAILESLRGKR